MASEWRKTTLGEFVRLQRGHDLAAVERKPGDYPVMGSAGPNGTHGEFIARGPGVVIGRSGASMGRVHFTLDDYWPHNTCLYVTDFLGNDPRFAFYLLGSLDLASYNSGSAQPSLNRNYIYTKPIQFPPPEEQRAIAETLGALDDRIDNLRQINATLEAIAAALFKSRFVDFDGVPPEGMQESELGLIPNAWRVGTVSNLAEIKGGKQLEKEHFDQQGENPIFGGAGEMGRTDLSNADGLVITVGRVGAYCGQFFWHLGSAWVNNNASRIVVGDDAGFWLYWVLRHVDIDKIKKGAAQPFVSNGDLAAMHIVIPDDATIQEFNSLACDLHRRMSLLSQQVATLAALRNGLLPRLISGQLRVSQ